MLYAILHILGAILALFLMGFLGIMLATWEQSLLEKRKLTEIAIKLKIPVDELSNPDKDQIIAVFALEKYDSDKFSNRFSDFCGIIRIIWNCLLTLLQFAILGYVVFFTFTDDYNNAVHAWWVVPVTLLSAFITVIFSLLCKLLTNRYPGEASHARKYITEHLTNQ